MDPVPIRFVAPTDTVTRAPAVRPLRVQNLSVTFTNVQERFTEYALILSPPSSAGAVHDANAVVFESDDTTKSFGASGTVAGTPNAVAVFEESAVELTEVIATIFTSYAVPLVRPVNVYEFVVRVAKLLVPSGVTAEPHEPPFTRKYTS